MKGLVFDTENRIQLKDFGEPLLDNLQKEVGGYIEVVHPRYLPEGLCMVVDDEGLLKGSPVNNIASILYGTPEHGQPIAGNAVILGEGFVDGERDFVSLTEDDKTNLMVWERIPVARASSLCVIRLSPRRVDSKILIIAFCLLLPKF